MKNAIDTAGRWLKVLAYLPALVVMVWLEGCAEERKRRYELGEI